MQTAHTTAAASPARPATGSGLDRDRGPDIPGFGGGSARLPPTASRLRCLSCLWLLAALLGGGCGAPETPVSTSAALAPMPPAAETIMIRTATPASFAAILQGRTAAGSAAATAILSLPAGQAGPVPAVIVADRLEARDDAEDPADDPYGPALTGAGIAVLRIDSLGRRGSAGGPAEAAALSPAAATYDAFQALRLLAADPRIDPERIAIMGFGPGGAVALHTAEDEVRRASVGDGLRFAAHLAVYPECRLAWDRPRPTARPIFLMLGEADDLAPADRCIDVAQRLGDAGAIVFAVLYRDQGHRFDSAAPVAFDPDRLNLARCDWGIAAGGEIYDRASGVRVGDDFAEFVARVVPGCARRGGHAGASADGRRRAVWEAYQFLRSSLLPQPPSPGSAG